MREMQMQRSAATTSLNLSELTMIGPRSNLCLRTNSGLGHPDAVESHRILQDGRELESSKNALCMFVSELACRISFPQSWDRVLNRMNVQGPCHAAFDEDQLARELLPEGEPW
ncbi:hypothetical protein HBI25_231040 [Parastagonospora nodorum]|nr:hypothetical protein HBI77_201160 [Parastagonospora nodorum]KAH5544158.1 hypothetical protein HBI25_231040 [Parastagonospora nodorum]